MCTDVIYVLCETVGIGGLLVALLQFLWQGILSSLDFVASSKTSVYYYRHVRAISISAPGILVTHSTRSKANFCGGVSQTSFEISLHASRGGVIPMMDC